MRIDYIITCQVVGGNQEKLVRREALEEAPVQIDVGQVAFLNEYPPFKNKEKYGKNHLLAMIFECELKEGRTTLYFR